MRAVADAPTPVRAIDAAGMDTIPVAELLVEGQPALLKGFGRDWPLVRAGQDGAGAAMAYLRRFDAGHRMVGYTGDPAIGGRFFYNHDITGLNFTAEQVTLADYLARMAATAGDPAAPALYLGSADLDTFLPGLRAENGPALGADLLGAEPVASIWIGNRTVAATHYDMSNNIACCMVGQRRFTLFPPDQVANLYPGPLEPTPGGQVVSMVDLRDPDLARYPRFAEALAHAQVAEMEPGDVLFYPALWWHNVEALDPFNAMINYWWNPVPRFADTPMNTLLHGLLSLRDRPEAEKQAWRAMFDYYVWGPPEQAAAHLPEHAQGALAPLDEVGARRLRARLLQKLNR
ncbi:cupin-like domain-containing protein [Croceibacterium ferulae]|uniref:cupin-like domain-containing protein n=1 Tax=Croceibacterium ferulae TaxID=1854641 RepID=UPI0013903352|nr:cupin-like domain-containing protein [Croceibacterium ferulae]